MYTGNMTLRERERERKGIIHNGRLLAFFFVETVRTSLRGLCRIAAPQSAPSYSFTTQTYPLMFSSINETISWCGPPEGRILIQDHLQSDGTFLLYHFLAPSLAQGQDVCIIGLEYTLEQYLTILKRLDASLVPLKVHERLILLDPFAQHGMLAPPDLVLDTLLESLQTWRKQSTRQEEGPAKWLLMVDNVTYLSMLGWSLSSLRQALSRLYAYVEQHQGRMVIRCPIDLILPTPHYDLFIRWLMYQSHRIFQVRPLAARMSKSTDGEVGHCHESERGH